MKIKLAMTVCACAFALWGCGSESTGTFKFDTAVTGDTASTKADGATDTVKLDAGADAVKADAAAAEVLPADAPQLLDSATTDAPQVLDGGRLDVPQRLDSSADVAADAGASEVGG